MASKSLMTWLRAKRKKALVSASAYSVFLFTGGAIALALTSCFVVLAGWIGLYYFFPHTSSFAGWSLTLGFATLVTVVFFVDSLYAGRDDMSILPLWLLREYLCIGPRAILESARQWTRARRFAELNLDVCAEVLSFLSTKNHPITQAELARAFPDLKMAALLDQLRLIEGVIIFRHDPSRVILTLPLRLELRRLLGTRKKVEVPPEEPQPTPVQEPEKLSPADILGVSPSASVAEIKLAYRRRIKECHPDRFAGMDERSLELAEEWTKAVNAAYATLLSERGRKRTTQPT